MMGDLTCNSQIPRLILKRHTVTNIKSQDYPHR